MRPAITALTHIRSVPQRRCEQRLYALLAVQLNNQLLVHWQLDIFPLRQTQHARLVIIAINFQPARQRAVTGKLLGQLKYRQLLAVFANGNFLARAHFIGRNVDLAIVDRDVSVTHQLPCLASRLRETQTVHNVVKTAFELLQQTLAGHALGARGLLKVVAELAFLREIDALGFLLLAELQAITDNFGLAVLPMLSGGEIALLDRTFIAEALCALEEQLHPLAAA